MRITLRSLLTLFALVCVSPMARAVDIYVLTNNNGGTSGTSTDFGRIDSVTGAYTAIANLPGNISNLAWNPAAGNFFTISGTDFSTLRTLTTAGTLSSSLGAINKTITGMALRTTNSVLYAYDWMNDETGTINPANGTWTQISTSTGMTASGNVGGRYTIMNDTMYMTNFNNSTGQFGTMGYTAATQFQQVGSTSLTFAQMVLANDGTTLYGIFGNNVAGQQRVYTINPANGVLTAGAFITGTGLGTNFHGAAFVPVPEPSTYALAAVATGVLAAIARRRKARGG